VLEENQKDWNWQNGLELKRPIGKDFLGFIGGQAVSQRQMEGVPFIPLKIRYPQLTLPKSHPSYDIFFWRVKIFISLLQKSRSRVRQNWASIPTVLYWRCSRSRAG
jgi:hypothetical protein